jgi:hypothetical protein
MNAPSPPPFDFNKRTEQYIKLRDRISEIKTKHKEELEPLNNLLEKLNDLLLGHLSAIGADSVSATAGTVYRTQRKSASLADKSAFWTYVVEQGAWDLLDYKANPVAVADFIKESEEQAKADPTIIPGPPPGVNYTVAWVAGIQRK